MKISRIAIIVALVSGTGGWPLVTHAGGTAKLLETDPAGTSFRNKFLEQRTAKLLREWGDLGSQARDPGKSRDSMLQAAMAVRETFKALSDLDAELDAWQARDAAGPDVPSSCAGGGWGCHVCFTAAYDEVNSARVVLEEVRTHHRRTIAYYDHVMRFGNSVSLRLGVLGMGWQPERTSLAAARANFNTTARNKYDELLRSMRNALDRVSACEAQHFNNLDWYDRFGVMYYDFVRETYIVPE